MCDSVDTLYSEGRTPHHSPQIIILIVLEGSGVVGAARTTLNAVTNCLRCSDSSLIFGVLYLIEVFHPGFDILLLVVNMCSLVFEPETIHLSYECNNRHTTETVNRQHKILNLEFVSKFVLIMNKAKKLISLPLLI